MRTILLLLVLSVLAAARLADARPPVAGTSVVVAAGLYVSTAAGEVPYNRRGAPPIR